MNSTQETEQDAKNTKLNDIKNKEKINNTKKNDKKRRTCQNLFWNKT